jgi:hypothetical protein
MRFVVGAGEKGSENVVGPMPHFREAIKTDDALWKIVAWMRSVFAVGEWKDVESTARDVLCAAIPVAVRTPTLRYEEPSLALGVAFDTASRRTFAD